MESPVRLAVPFGFGVCDVRLWKISYISRATVPDEGIEQAIGNICALARRRNALLDVTGVLTIRGARFAQVLEGPEMSLRALMDSISHDPRHRDIDVIADGPLDMRRYPDWNMVYRDPKDFVRDQLDMVLEQTALMGRLVSARVH